MLGLALYVLLAVAAGVSVVVQQVLNSNLRMALNSARSSFLCDAEGGAE